MLVHFIWVGSQTIPQSFTVNLQNFKEKNPSIKVLEWSDEVLAPLIRSYDKYDLYCSSSVFHKLQIARYTVLDFYGGLYTDYDVHWRVPVIDALGDRLQKKLVFTKRKSSYFYKKGEEVHRTPLLDDYVIYAQPGITNNFLDYSLDRFSDKIRIKDCPTEPFSVYSLTEWIFDSNFEYDCFDHSEIYDSEDCSIAFHENKKTWTSA